MFGVQAAKVRTAKIQAWLGVVAIYSVMLAYTASMKSPGSSATRRQLDLANTREGNNEDLPRPWRSRSPAVENKRSEGAVLAGMARIILAVSCQYTKCFPMLSQKCRGLILRLSSSLRPCRSRYKSIFAFNLTMLKTPSLPFSLSCLSSSSKKSSHSRHKRVQTSFRWNSKGKNLSLWYLHDVSGKK